MYFGFLKEELLDYDRVNPPISESEESSSNLHDLLDLDA